jgi:hypothetical protein
MLSRKRRLTFESLNLPFHIDGVLPIPAFSILTKTYVYIMQNIIDKMLNKVRDIGKRIARVDKEEDY